MYGTYSVCFLFKLFPYPLLLRQIKYMFLICTDSWNVDANPLIDSHTSLLPTFMEDETFILVHS